MDSWCKAKTVSLTYKALVSILVCAIPLVANGAPTDGLIHWSATDKHSNIQISPDGLSVTSVGSGRAGVRSNRPVYPGEGFYYFEIDSTSVSIAYDIGVATAAEVLDTSPISSGQSAILLSNGQISHGTGWHGSAGGNPDVTGVALDYRGDYPVVHFLARLEGGSEIGVSSIVMDSVINEPVYMFLNTSPTNVGGAHVLNMDRNTFALDYETLIQEAAYQGHQGLLPGWPIDNDEPQAQILEGDVVALSGETIDLTVLGTDTESGDVSASAQWVLDGVSVGSGSSLQITPAVGEHRIAVQVEDAIGQLSLQVNARITVIADGNIDSDWDTLSYNDELVLGTNPARYDTDQDGIADHEESVHGTSAVLADTDADGMDDGYEVDNTLNPLLDDAAGDLDADTHTNLGEYLANKSANNANDFPGAGHVELNAADATVNATISADALGLDVTPATGVAAARSDVAIQPESGWHYFEGTRLAAPGNFGFGVATATADLNAVLGGDSNSLVMDTNGDVTYEGVVVASMTSNPEHIETYGFAVDYSGTTAVVHIFFQETHQEYEFLAPVTLTNTSGALHIVAYGESQIVGEQQRINAGEDKVNTPFRYSARYLLNYGGFTSARTMRNGWGDEYFYQPLTKMPLEERVVFTKGKGNSQGINLAEDELGVSYLKEQKSAILANQGMIGEFWYWEAHRNLEPGNYGFGLNNPYTFLDSYCCIHTSLEEVGPSMSVNSLGGIWRNLQFQGNYPRDTEASYYGYAVDYRGDYPVVYVISLEGVVYEMHMDDFITEIYPMIYGNPQGPVEVNSGNFGVEPFHYNARQALKDFGVDVNEFRPGWGIHAQDQHLGFGADEEAQLVVNNAAQTTVALNDGFTLSASASDYEDGDLTASVTWTKLEDGTVYAAPEQFVNLPVGSHTFTASVTDSAGRTVTSDPIELIIEEPVAPDTDGDGLNDIVESFFGTNPNLADTDADGLDDAQELNELNTDPLLADTDADGMGDAYEVAYGHDPLVDDASSDIDGDTYTNLDEMIGGTDPYAILNYPGAPAAQFDRLVAINDLGDFSALSFNGTNYTVLSSGGDTGGDEGYQFAYTTLTGNGEIVAMLTDIPGTYLGKGGLMIRNTLEVNSVSALAGFGGAGNTMYSRTTEGSETRDEFFGNNGWQIGMPHWMRLVRLGDQVTAYRSTDGASWVEFNSVSIPLNETVYIGLFAVANNGGAVESIVMENALLTAIDSSPALDISGAASNMAMGETLNLSAVATDPEDGDISADVSWSIGLVTSTGSTFDFTPSESGDVEINVSIEDSFGNITLDVINVSVAPDYDGLDDDFDGLTNGEETLLGTDLANADTDGDSLSDGDEVLLHGTDPLSADTDGDLMSDDYEVALGFDPLLDDGSDDADGDGVSNVQESIDGTDPLNASDYVGAPLPANVLSNNVVIGAGSATSYDVLSDNSYRLNAANQVAAGENNAYFVYAEVSGDFESTAQVTHEVGERWAAGGIMIRNNLTIDSAYSSALNTEDLGPASYYALNNGDARSATNLWGQASGWVRLVREGNVVTAYHSTDGSGWNQIDQQTIELNELAYVGLYFNSGNASLEGSVRFDSFELAESNAMPEVVISSASQTVLLGETLNLTVAATDLEDGDLSASVEWDDGGVIAVGASYDFVASVVGDYDVVASVTDSFGQTVTDTISISVQPDYDSLDDDSDGLTNGEETLLGTDLANADTDGDSLSDGDEVNIHGTDPLNTDSDGDLMSDDYEVVQGFDPLLDDGSDDADGDGFTNAQEAADGTDPFNSADYFGAPPPANVLADEVIIGTADHGYHSVIDDDSYELNASNQTAAGEKNTFFVYTQVSGDLEAIVQVTHNAGQDWAYGGLMIRNNLTLDSAYSSALTTMALGPAAFYAINDGDAREAVNLWNQPTGWVRMVREGNVISNYHSADGASWVLIDQQTIALNQNVYIGLSYVSGRLGVDGSAVFDNFQIIESNATPEVVISSATQTVLLGETLNLSATATDIEDGDLASSIEWDDDGLTSFGATYDFVATEVGEFVVTASASDTAANTGSDSITITVQPDYESLDDDSDGLTNGEEIILGTDLANPDSDGDTLTDGDEVNLHGTDPLNSDTDGDLMPDDYEIAQGFNALLDDGADADGDGFSDAQEYQDGTDPFDASDYFGAPPPANLLTLDAMIGDGTGSFSTQSDVAYTLESDAIAAAGENDSYFVYAPVSGDFDAVVQVTDIVGPSHSHGGLMVRNDLSLTSAYASSIILNELGTGAYYAANEGDSRVQYNGWNQWRVSTPHWLRMVRIGSTVTTYESDDGVTWTEMNEETIDLNTDVLFGLSMVASNGVDGATAIFDNLSLTNL
ncbi:MAG: DUF1349 domain-containing protein [Agarilytica sp.]